MLLDNYNSPISEDTRMFFNCPNTGSRSILYVWWYVRHPRRTKFDERSLRDLDLSGVLSGKHVEKPQAFDIESETYVEATESHPQSSNTVTLPVVFVL